MCLKTRRNFSAASGVGLGVQKPSKRKSFQARRAEQLKWPSGAAANKKGSMKKVMLLTAIIAITSLSLSAADDAPAKKAPKDLSADIVKKYDKDGDGKLSKEEKQAYRADLKKEKKGTK